MARQNLESAFREDGRAGTASRGLRMVRKGLVVAQVAVALVLLAGAGLLLASFQELLAVDPGFDPDGVLTARVRLPARYPDLASEAQFLEPLLQEIGQLPGVLSAGAASQVPLGGRASDSVIFAEGHVPEPGESPISPLQTFVTPGYLETMRVRLLQGRFIAAADTADAERVIVIDSRLARRFWPDGDALGKRLYQPTSAEDFANPENARFYRIVGIVEPVRHHGLDTGGEVGAYYIAVRQAPFPPGGYFLTARTRAVPTSVAASIRTLVQRHDRQMPVYDVATMTERVRGALADRRAPLALALAFGVVALVLAAVGIYGVLAHLVSLRTRELGIRVALGSDASRIFVMVLREGGVLLLAGLLMGLAGAAALGRVIESRLYGVTALDPAVLLAVAAVLAAAGLIACVVPARRATRIDPVAALTDA